MKILLHKSRNNPKNGCKLSLPFNVAEQLSIPKQLSFSPKAGEKSVVCETFLDHRESDKSHKLFLAPWKP
jgi:hypothetical protein